MAQALSASLEDYLEAIFHLGGRAQGAHVKDIARRLRVRAPSVTCALRTLAERGMVHYVPYDAVTLTPQGQEKATQVVRRHEALRGFLVTVLGVPVPEADPAACAMEHAVPESILARLVQYVEFVARCPRGRARLVQGSGYFCEPGVDAARCQHCMQLGLDSLRAEMEATPTAVPTASVDPSQDQPPPPGPAAG